MKKSISKKLEQSRKRTSRLWKHYRSIKKQLLSKKRTPLDIKRGLIAEQRDITRQNISVTWEDYRGWKFGAIHHSPYEDFSFVKRIYTPNTKQEWYKSRERYFEDYSAIESKLDYQIDKILDEPGVKGVMLIFRVKDDDTELIHNVSDYVTRMSFDRLNAQGVSMYQNLSDKLKFSRSVTEYEMKGISIRIIYEKSKKI
jgi:hypothetical protein